MSRIAYFVHGRGRGHAVRTRSCVAALRAAGHEVVVSAGGAAEDVLGAAIDRRVTPVLPNPSFVVRGVRRLAADIAWLRSEGVDLVVTDGDAPGLHAAAWLGLPSIAVGRGLASVYCATQTSLGSRGGALDRFKSRSSAWLATRRVAVHFLPIAARDPATRVARPDLEALPTHPATDANLVLAYFRDQNGDAILEALSRADRQIVCFGARGDLPGPVESRPFDGDAFVDLARSAHSIVCSAGSNLLAEAIALGKPVLAMYRRGDYEQAANALGLADAGLGIAATFDEDPAAVARRFDAWLREESPARLDLRDLLEPVSEVVLALVAELGESRPE